MPRHAPLKHGDITVYQIPGTPIPIVHRVIETHDECAFPFSPPLQLALAPEEDKDDADGFDSRTCAGATRPSSGS